jgi:hypothetical protein
MQVKNQKLERRRCRRFKVPSAELKYKKLGLQVFIKGFSEPFSVVNVSKGGLAFICEDEFRPNQKLMVQLLTPDEDPLNLYSEVRWRGHVPGIKKKVVGVQFMPFMVNGKRNGGNSLEDLEPLNRLDKQYRE